MREPKNQNRIHPVDPDHATGAIKRLFAEIRTKFALVPNLFRVLANAPAALEGLMGLSAALARGALDEKTREQLALAIADRHRAAGEDSAALRRASLAACVCRAPNRRSDLPGTSAR
jgi:hypothetical protein